MMIDLNAILLALFGGGLTVLASNVIRFTDWFRKSRVESKDAERDRLERRADDAEADADQWVRQLRDVRRDGELSEAYIVMLRQQIVDQGLTPVPRPRKE